jgi:hypothetical protein
MRDGRRVSARRRIDADGRALTELTLQERRERLERFAAMVRRSVGATLVVPSLLWSLALDHVARVDAVGTASPQALA